MVAQFIIVLSLAVATTAIPLIPIAKVSYAEPEAPANYEFEYSVKDGYSGDVKQQKESRTGDAVQGSYSLVQPDGVLRIVDYTSDKETGFNANVRYEGKPVEAPAKLAYAAPVAYAAPAKFASYAAPVAYTAPVAKFAYAPPVAKATSAVPVVKQAYPAPLAQVTFSSPAVSYNH